MVMTTVIMDLYCETIPKQYWVFSNTLKRTQLWEVFSQIQFFQEELYPPLHTFLLVQLVHLLQKAISMLTPWKCKVSQIIRFLIKPLLKNSTQTIFSRGYPMSDPDPQQCNWFHGTLLCTKTVWVIYLD